MSALRARLLFALSLAAGCAPTRYTCHLESSERSSRIARAQFDDPDLLAEVALTADAIVLHLTPKVDGTVDVRWDALALVGPNHRQEALAPAEPPGPLTVGAALTVRLPYDVAGGAAAWRSSRTQLELIVPTVVRGVAREYHFHLRARRSRA